MAKYIMGSTYFFSCYDDFKSKDIDEIEIIETNNFKWCRQLTGQGRCLFQLNKQKNTEDYIEYALQSKLGMVVGKFLIPEFCKEIGFTIKDLQKLKPLIDILDEEHKYEEIIYNSYIENNDFVLKKEQRKNAYDCYKNTRGY